MQVSTEVVQIAGRNVVHIRIGNLYLINPIDLEKTSGIGRGTLKHRAGNHFKPELLLSEPTNGTLVPRHNWEQIVQQTPHKVPSAMDAAKGWGY